MSDRRRQSTTGVFLFFSCFLVLLCTNQALVLSQDTAEVARPAAGLSGTLTDGEGNPVTDATVTLQGSRYYTTKVDEKGKFEFADQLEPGEFRLGIRSMGWIGIKSYRDMPIVYVDPDKPTKQDFVLEKACQMKINISDGNQAVSGASIYYQPVGGEDRRNADSARTDANGIANIGGLQPGKYQLGIHSKNHALAMAIVEVTTSKEAVEQEIVLESGETFQATILCSDNFPPAGWQIRALPIWWKFGVYPGGIKVAEDGSFELPHIVDELYDVSVSIPLGDHMSTSRMALTNSKLLQLEQPARLRLDYPSPRSLNYLTGTIRWIGKPLDDSVRISGYCADLKHHASFHLQRGKSDFKIGPMPSGIYRIQVENSEVEVMNLRKIKGLDDLEHITVPNEQKLQLALRVVGKPTLRGNVVDDATGKPVETFRYRITKLRTLSGPNYVQEDIWKQAQGGRFESEVVGPGIYEVSVWADGYAMLRSDYINTNEQPDKVISFKLASGFPMQGTVLGSDGKPVAGAQVRVLSLAGGGMPRVRNRFASDQGAQITDAEGKFHFSNLAEGEDAIRVDHPDYVFQEIQGIEISEDSKPLSVTLSKGASVEGTVYDAKGQPLPNEVLYFRDSYAYGGGDRELGTFARVVTNEQGGFRVSNLPSTVVYVNRAEEWSVLGVVRNAFLAKDGERHKLNIGGTNALQGTLLVNGEPLDSTKLQIGGDDPMFGAMKMYGSTDSDGAFTFRGVPPGQWTLYRALDDRGGEWSRIRPLVVSANEDTMELGQIDIPVGVLTVRCNVSTGSVPEGMRLDLRSKHPTAYFGRSAGNLKPRSGTEDPFIFYSVSPGDYELASYLPTGHMILQDMTVEATDLGKSVDFVIPQGDETLTVDVRSEDESDGNHSCTLTSQDGRLVAFASSQAESGESQLIFNNLPAGTYTLSNGNLRDAPALKEIEVIAGAENHAQVVLPSNDSLGLCNLLIVDEDGRYLPCELNLLSPDGIRAARNAFELSMSGPVGEHAFEIDHPGYQPLEGTLTIRKVDRSLQSEDYQQVVVLKK